MNEIWQKALRESPLAKYAPKEIGEFKCGKENITIYACP